MKNICRKVMVRAYSKIKRLSNKRYTLVERLCCKIYKLRKISGEDIKINGLFAECDKGLRLPGILVDILGKKNRRLKSNARCLSGCYIDFYAKTAQCIIEITIGNYIEINHMTSFGTSGVDMYIINNKSAYIWKGCYVPNYYGKVRINVGKNCNMREGTRIRIYFPMFVSVSDIRVFIDSNAEYMETLQSEEAVCFYGSSITQGCAASRPGLSYPALVGRYLNCPIYNLGFSESAHGEEQIADWIGKQKFRCIVVEYDHNASLDMFRDTHYRFYKVIRQNNKNALIIFLSRASIRMTITYNEYIERKNIIKDTISRACLAGDDRIQYIDGYIIFGDGLLSDYFVDGKHPNDRGMLTIAEKIVEKIIECEKNNTNVYEGFI